MRRSLLGIALVFALAGLLAGAGAASANDSSMLRAMRAPAKRIRIAVALFKSDLKALESQPTATNIERVRTDTSYLRLTVRRFREVLLRQHASSPFGRHWRRVRLQAIPLYDRGAAFFSRALREFEFGDREGFKHDLARGDLMLRASQYILQHG